MPDADSLSAALDAIREREQRAKRPAQAPPGDVPRLLAALDAALELHKPFGGTLDPDACAGCDETVPCRTIQAISRALLGGTDD